MSTTKRVVVYICAAQIIRRVAPELRWLRFCAHPSISQNGVSVRQWQAIESIVCVVHPPFSFSDGSASACAAWVANFESVRKSHPSCKDVAQAHIVRSTMRLCVWCPSGRKHSTHKHAYCMWRNVLNYESYKNLPSSLLCGFWSPIGVSENERWLLRFVRV